MLTELRVTKDGEIVYQARHEIVDAASFGQACSQAWNAIEERRIQSATSIGALFDDLENISSLDGIMITLHSAPG